MKYRRLDSKGDMTFGQSSANFLQDSPEAVAQAIETRLELWLGEFFLDVTDGVPWQTILGSKNRTIVDPVLRKRISDTPGVQTINRLDMQFNPDIRKLVLTADVMTQYGRASVSTAV